MSTGNVKETDGIHIQIFLSPLALQTPSPSSPRRKGAEYTIPPCAGNRVQSPKDDTIRCPKYEIPSCRRERSPNLICDHEQ